jgi:hypothetical protein
LTYKWLWSNDESQKEIEWCLQNTGGNCHSTNESEIKAFVARDGDRNRLLTYKPVQKGAFKECISERKEIEIFRC